MSLASSDSEPALCFRSAKYGAKWQVPFPPWASVSPSVECKAGLEMPLAFSALWLRAFGQTRILGDLF